MKHPLNKYIDEKRGAVAIMFGFLLPVMFAAGGVATDLSQAYLVKARLGAALDAAALAGAATGSDDEGVVQEKVDAFVEANYPTGRIGTPMNVVASLDEDTITVSATARLNTSFMRVFGYDTIDVDARTVVQREVRGLEVVMVLDNTGSMSTDNNIGTLRTATRNFINILFDSVDDANHVKVGLVPYASSVNVGPYGQGLDMDGNNYGTPFVIPNQNDPYEKFYGSYDPNSFYYNPGSKYQWHGCVLAENYPLDTEDHIGPWEMYRHDYNGFNNFENNWYSYPNYTYGDYYNYQYGPNVACPDQPIIPLNSNRNRLLNAANNMAADGNTLGNFGMVWGWRVLSPEEPFIEGAAYESEDWDKVAVVMTDGINTMSPYYTAYGKTNDHWIDAGDLDDRFAETCEAMKQQQILVYAVTFDDGVDQDTKDLFRECATTPGNYHDAPTQSELLDVFEQIARELSNLYIQQ
jgi:Flp pilus assembly protein TadG